jgi:hypothetical protein
MKPLPAPFSWTENLKNRRLRLRKIHQLSFKNDELHIMITKENMVRLQNHLKKELWKKKKKNINKSDHSLVSSLAITTMKLLKKYLLKFI